MKQQEMKQVREAGERKLAMGSWREVAARQKQEAMWWSEQCGGGCITGHQVIRKRAGDRQANHSKPAMR